MFLNNHSLDPSLSDRIINSLCAYVEAQIISPKVPKYTRDLHTMIVAAYHCLYTWVLANDVSLDSKRIGNIIVVSARVVHRHFHRLKRLSMQF